MDGDLNRWTRFQDKREKETAMLSTVVWLAVAREKRGLTMLGAFLLLAVLGVLAWNLVP